jgi:uncharacterized hydrophobic protein (TIGR00271 family)
MNSASVLRLAVMLHGGSHPIARLQDRLAGLLGTTVDARPRLVLAMLHRNPTEATSYWLQLVVSVGIATLGLVVGSTAVVIGAMLVAPLMGPIVGLAMGLSTGSPFLVLRSAARIVLSVVVAVAGAASITFLLPFHELNAEIAARTSPTVLDLITAAFCALAGVYASLRPGSETATTAAGTSISISLVPPLCASGYGFGTLSWPVAGGAALLFLTNLVAIVVVGTVTFVAAGFNRVDVTTLEREELEQNGGARFSRAVSRRLAGVFESSVGPALRFFMPVALLAAVYLPLRRALDEVAWEVRVRAAVRAALSHENEHIVQSRIHVERREVELAVVVIGSAGEADGIESRLVARIQPTSGVPPRVQVLAVPDATAFAGLESALRTPSVPLLPIVPALDPPAARIRSALEIVRDDLARVWPAESAGDLLSIEVAADSAAPMRVRVLHLGAPLETQAQESLGNVLTDSLAREAILQDVAIPATELVRKQGDLEFVAAISALLSASASVPELSVCVTRSDVAASEPPSAADQELARTLDRLLSGRPRVEVVPGADFRVRAVIGACPKADPAPAASSPVTP